MLFARLSEDGNCVVVKIEDCDHERRMNVGPQTFFITQNHRCEYCHFPAAVALLAFQIDHVISQEPLGETIAGNLALSRDPTALPRKRFGIAPSVDERLSH